MEGAPQLDRLTMGMMARSLAFRGEAVFLPDGDRAVPCADWDLPTVEGRQRAYRLSVSVSKAVGLAFLRHRLEAA